MIAYKQLLTSNVIVTPFEVNKSFTFSGSGLTDPTVSIDRFIGNNTPFISGSNNTGYISTQNQSLIYSSIKQLYYSNYLSSSYGDPVNSAILIPGANSEGNVLVGTTPSPGMYDNYLQTTLTFAKYFPTNPSNIIRYDNYPQIGTLGTSLYTNNKWQDGLINLWYSASYPLVSDPDGGLNAFWMSASWGAGSGAGIFQYQTIEYNKNYVLQVYYQWLTGTDVNKNLSLQIENYASMYISSSGIIFSGSGFPSPGNVVINNSTAAYTQSFGSWNLATLEFKITSSLTSSLQTPVDIYQYRSNTSINETSSLLIYKPLLYQQNTIGVISIPSRLFGDYIQPNSFIYKFTSDGNTYTITDDGEGNIKLNNNIIGNIFYPQGMITITDSSYKFISGSITTNNVTCSFSSSYTIYETQYKCTVRENEFNYTLNPTLQSDSSGSLYSYTTSSQWSPYITTIGLYDEEQNLLAVGKLSQPLQTSATTDTTILVNIDM